jgi:hypothetical protein
MKQSLVTKKNRKVKLLRAIYPHLNTQVFCQKDFKNLIFKYGLAERTSVLSRKFLDNSILCGRQAGYPLGACPTISQCKAICGTRH